mgnify:CR=1 FL=1
MPDFIPGLELSEAFFREGIQPLMAAHFPALAYSAARLDWGSDVLVLTRPCPWTMAGGQK